MRALADCSIPFRAPSGDVIAYLRLVPVKEGACVSAAPLIELEEQDAQEFGETAIQLRESERYEYEVRPISGRDLRLRSSLSSRRKSIGESRDQLDSGLIETRSFCGSALLELVEGEVTEAKTALAAAVVDVRSIKLDYRTEYRGMLRRIADEMVGLVVDARSSAKLPFRSTFEYRSEKGWLQIQLELLRETLDSAEFSAALQRVLKSPHERMSPTASSISTDRQIRWSSAALRQLVNSERRREVPIDHPLRGLGLESVAERVVLSTGTRSLDTPENRFIKFALGEFRAFLAHAHSVFHGSGGWGASAATAKRLSAKLDDWLSRGFFRELGTITFAPFGSPVLQRKAGYRDVFRSWLRFRSAAELSWEGGEDLFRAGQRDVASLYEYWLFFELLKWFCEKCRAGSPPELDELVDGLFDGAPTLRLRKRIELGPFVGTFVGQSRRLSARFCYNRRFEVTAERHIGGSWSRRLHPDYTLTFWPADICEADAESQELLVHVHFDAKYRVEDIESVFGNDDADDSDDEIESNYKRQDLLKMHAYRDAIKRSQGAYVLYPGRSNAAVRLKGFHEILPGLGAFGVVPDETGAAQGMTALGAFLDEVLVHVGNRTTAQERLSYHVAESYVARETAVGYGSLVMAEYDELSDSSRALPPAEHHVVLAWYDSDEQLAWTFEKGIANVRLGDRPGTWLIPPEMASARHVLLRTHRGVIADGLFRLRTPGYRVYTAKDLINKGYPGAASGEIYAVFEIEPDPAFTGRKWNGAEIMKQLVAFESKRAYRQVKTLNRRSPDPRVLSLQELLRAMNY